MAVDPNLLVIKPVDQLPQNNNPSEGDHLLSYNQETKELQKTDFGEFLADIASGWTMQTVTEEYTRTNGEKALIEKVTGYTGGTGAIPAELAANVGKYKSNGGFTNDKELALNYRAKADPTKLPLYSAIKSANIVAETQFIDDENGNIQYRVKAGQTLLTSEVPANVVGTKVEKIGGTSLIPTKNIFKGLRKYTSVSDTVVNASNNEGSIALIPIPVEQGKYYTVSGLGNYAGNAARVVGLSSDYLPSNTSQTAATVSQLFPKFTNGKFTIYIDNPAVTHITAQVKSSTNSAPIEEVSALKIQVEEGQVVTNYIVPKIIETGDAIIESANLYTDRKVSEVTTTNAQFYNDRISDMIFDENIAPSIGAYGWNFSIKNPLISEDSQKGQLFKQLSRVKSGFKNVLTNVVSLNPSGNSTGKQLNVLPFTIPSGILENTPNEISTSNKDFTNYVHPSVAYSSTTIGGYKYWMVASVLPSATAETGATTEDEDLFVTNTPEDSASWKRVRSLYEDDKPHTTTTLRLPPVPSTWSANSRRNGFLPIPKGGLTIEISSPAHNGYAALNSVNKTLSTTRTPFKHDPAICVHGGYIYVLHSFHLYYADSPDNQHKFNVLTRTSDGINWVSVRRDGTTYALDSEAAVERLFTKDTVSGKYNYWHYQYKTGWSNPEFVVYGPNDVELVWGNNFAVKFAGTTPFNIDLDTPLTFKDMGNVNHPGLLWTGSKLILVNAKGVYYSIDRGLNFTAYPKNPLYVGGDIKYTYKRALTMAEGGKIIFFDVLRFYVNNSTFTPVGVDRDPTRFHKMIYTIYPSVANFETLANNGISVGYVDIMLIVLNYKTQARRNYFFPNLSPSSATTLNRVVRTKAGEIEVKDGDIIYAYATVNARNGGSGAFSEIIFEDKL